MSYEVGTYISLDHINKRKPAVQKKSFPQHVQTLHEVGAQYVARYTPEGLIMALKIPVAAA